MWVAERWADQLGPIPLTLESDFFAKEALAKALGDALLYDPRRLESPRTWLGGNAGRWHAAELPVGPSHLAWICWAGDEVAEGTGSS